MYRYLSLFLFLLLGACQSRQSKQPSTDGDSTATELSADTLASGDYYKRFSGTVGGKPVVVHLQYVHGHLEGAYQYLSQGKVVELRDFEDTTMDEIHELIEFFPGQTSESASWTFSIIGRSASGEWRDPVSGARSEINLNEDYPKGSIPLQVYSVVDSVHLFADKQDGPRAMSSYTYMQPRGAGMLNELLSRQLFADHVAGEELAISIRKANQSYFENYRKDNASLAASSETAGFSLNYDEEVSQRVLFNDQDWLVVELLTTSYTGGAHSNYFSSYSNIDRASNRVWNLGDIVTDTVALRLLVNEAAIIYFGIRPGTRIADRLFVPSVPVTTNFYLSATGLCFVYNPYEITNYAEGQIKLFIPFTRMQPFLQPAFRSRMHLTTEHSNARDRI